MADKSAYLVTITETTVRTYTVNPCRDEADAVQIAFDFWRFGPSGNGNVTEHVAVEQVTEVRPCHRKDS